MSSTFIVSGSYGELTVDRKTGNVVSYKSHPTSEPKYENIIRFDVGEYIETYGRLYDHIDILDITCEEKSGYICTFSENYRKRQNKPKNEIDEK